MTVSLEYEPNILILSTVSCAYPGADTAGQMHLDYPLKSFIIRVPAPVIFPEEFYFFCFEKCEWQPQNFIIGYENPVH